MPQPDYVPLNTHDRVRPAERLPAPGEWLPERPGDIEDVRQPIGPKFGWQGPDQGYGIKLVNHLADRIELRPGEHLADVQAGALSIGLKRAALFGRAPVVHDFELALVVWGYFTDAPPAELVDVRRDLFSMASHHYEDQRAIAESVPESTLRMTPAAAAEKLSDWRSLIDI